MVNVYKDGFTDWNDVQRRFLCKESEPETVFLAEYRTMDYEGYALVMYRNKDRYYIVEAWHCSCYQLEGQFKPEEYDRQTFIETVSKSPKWLSALERYNI